MNKNVIRLIIYRYKFCSLVLIGVVKKNYYNGQKRNSKHLLWPTQDFPCKNCIRKSNRVSYLMKENKFAKR